LKLYEVFFIYIADLVKIVNKLITKKTIANKIFYISSKNRISILEILKKFQSKYKLTIKYIDHNKGDDLNTHKITKNRKIIKDQKL
jgi:nucleoside-diphosphate-sugar epimerase